MRWLSLVLLVNIPVPAQVRGVLRPRPEQRALDSPEQKMTGEFAISGAVVDASTGEPVRKALIRINGGGANPGDGFAQTDAGGSFTIRGLEAGTYTILAEKPGYWPDTPRNQSQSITVGTGIETPVARFKMVRQGVLVGKVRDENSDPVPNTNVQVFRKQVREGRHEWQPAGGQMTNDVGEYRISLQPGAYLVSVSVNTFPFFRGRGRRRIGDDRPPVSYPTIYYPNVMDAQSAVPVVLASGQEQHADFDLRPGAVFQVSGRITNAPAQRGMGISLAPLHGDITGRRLGANFTQPDGAFTIAGVAPGTYQLQVDAFGSPEEHLAARQTVTVSDNDVAGLEVTLAPAFDIPVHVRTEDGSTAPVTHVFMTNDGTHQVFNAGPDKDGAMVIRGLTPGAYRLGVAAGNNLYVKSATLGGVDVLDRGMEWSGPSGPVEVTLGTKGGTLSGHIGNGSEPVTSADVVVLRNTADGQFALVRQVHASGADFTASGLAPGSYVVLAARDAQNLEYAEPGVLKKYQDYTQTVNIEEKAEQQLQLKLAPVL